MFVLRLKMPSNYAVPAHWHPTDEKVTLVEGKLAYGMSDRLDKASAQMLAPGESVTMKAKMHHWVLTGDGADRGGERDGPVPDHLCRPEHRPARSGEAEAVGFRRSETSQNFALARR